MKSSHSDISDENTLLLGLELPNTFAVSVIMEKRPSASPWAEHSWNAVGVTVGEVPVTKEPVRILQQGEIEQFLHTGFVVQLHNDECERYYHNLMSPTPRCFVIATKTDNEPPRPYLVTLDFDEAHAYEEGDESVFSVDIPPELYRWCEAFLLEHYVQEKKFKRKLTDWSAPDSGTPKS